MAKNVVQSKTKMVPKLRFPGFSDEWKIKNLGKICEYKNGGSFESNVVEDGTYSLITLNSIGIDGKLKSYHKTVNAADWFLQKDDLVMVLSDVSHGNFLGLSDIIPCDNKYVLNQRMGLLRKNDSDVDLNFLRLYINKRQHYFKLHGQGSSQQNLSKGDILKFRVYLPLSVEQNKISSFLMLVDKLIENLKSQKELLEVYKKGMMQKIFSQEIRFKDDNGKDFPKWAENILGDCLDYEQPTKYIVNSTEYEDSFKTPVLTAGKSFILGYTDELNDIFFNGLPVIIFDDFTTATQFVDFPFKVKSSAMKILKPKNGINIKFIFEAIQQIKYKIGGHGRHWISKYSNIRILVPSLSEQEKNADFLISIDRLVGLRHKKIIKAEEWKKGLMQELFI